VVPPSSQQLTLNLNKCEGKLTTGASKVPTSSHRLASASYKYEELQVTYPDLTHVNPHPHNQRLSLGDKTYDAESLSEEYSITHSEFLELRSFFSSWVPTGSIVYDLFASASNRKSDLYRSRKKSAFVVSWASLIGVDWGYALIPSGKARLAAHKAMRESVNLLLMSDEDLKIPQLQYKLQIPGTSFDPPQGIHWVYLLQPSASRVVRPRRIILDSARRIHRLTSEELTQGLARCHPDELVRRGIVFPLQQVCKKCSHQQPSWTKLLKTRRVPQPMNPLKLWELLYHNPEPVVTELLLQQTYFGVHSLYFGTRDVHWDFPNRHGFTKQPKAAILTIQKELRARRWLGPFSKPLGMTTHKGVRNLLIVR